MLVSYPALFYKDPEGEKLPKASNINEISIKENDPFKDDEEFKDYYIKNDSFISMVFIDIEKYLDYKNI